MTTAVAAAPPYLSARRPAGWRVGEARPRAAGAGRKRTSGEALLHAAWRRAARSGTPLYTRDGDAYRVVYAGRPADGSGPDFRDAVLLDRDGRRIRGDVEIHIRPSGWREHGHDRDPRYNGVVFHVAGPAHAPAEARTESGLLIPLLALGPVPKARASTPARVPRLLPGLTLAEAGDRRFLAKSAGLALEMRRGGPDQALYAAVLECLGYSGNRRGFRQLADRLPWPQLAAIAASGAGDLAPVLLWAGGFHQRPEGVPQLAGRPANWVAVHGRPDNAPARRIRGAAALAGFFLRAGGPLEALAAAVNAARRARDVAEALAVAAPPGEARALIGPGRASEISVNAVLPGVHAWACLTENGPLEERCRALYRAHPKTPENALTREARRRLSMEGRRPRVRGAREQQGLIYLYRALSPVVA